MQPYLIQVESTMKIYFKWNVILTR